MLPYTLEITLATFNTVLMYDVMLSIKSLTTIVIIPSMN